MRRRDNAGGKVVKTRRRRTSTHRNAPKAARRRGSSAAVQETKVARLTRELKEAREQQTATGEILASITGSITDAKPVFAAIVRNLRRLFGTRLAVVQVLRDGMVHLAAAGDELEFKQLSKHFPQALDENTGGGRAMMTKQVLQFVPVLGNPAAPPATQQFARALGFNSVIFAPMIRGGKVIGAISTARREPKAFDDKQVALIKAFADQAVIAIENVRQFNETKEALEQQTATSEVLQVISSSPGELEPVFKSLLANATKLCEASYGIMWLWDGSSIRAVALHGALPEAYLERLRGGMAFRPSPNMPGMRAMTERKPIHVADLSKEPVYLAGDPLAAAAVEDAGIRTLVVVPLSKDDQAVGNITIYRREVRPFSDKQVELLANFAAQAVIAIENTRLLSELRESLERQTATSEVLKVISSSPGDLQPVFQSMLENATKLCKASYGTLWLTEPGGFRAAARHGSLPDIKDEKWWTGTVFQPGPDVPLSRCARARAAVHVADMREEPAYLAGDPWMVTGVDIGGLRSLVVVPMLKDRELVGAIAIYRREMWPFTDKQIELVTNFAAQAVIAIENTRLFKELRQRTDDLSESLAQQTATADVLKVIASSTGEIAPVFDALLANATRLCEASFGALWLTEDDAFRTAALYGDLPQAYLDQWRSGTLFHPSPDVPMARVAVSHKPVQVENLRDTAAYRNGDRLAVTGVDDAGIRTILAVPMLKDKHLVGVFAIYRREVKPFVEKQVDLVTNFAAQAVIAIENTRLLNELRESLQQQTATADVLKVISRSTFDLETVLNTLLESATRLCEGQISWVFQRDGEILRWAASYGHTAEVHAAIRDYFKPLEVPIDRGSVVGRAASEAAVVHIPDVLADPEYRWQGAQKIGGYRACLGAPLLREGKVVGVLFVAKTAPQPFTEKQIELVKTFADQAVIAIENTRLLNELRESLAQQTATADILKVISSSTFELQPVFDSMAESAVRLCEAERAYIFRFDGQVLRAVASCNAGPENQDWVYRNPIPLGRHSISARAGLERRTVQVADIQVDPEYSYVARDVDPIRTTLAVPMLKGDELIGTITIYRLEVKPFAENQIALMETFADQAVIAIENARLFENLQTRTRELAKSLDDLRTTQDRLVQTQKLASLGQLTAGIAHEIKNPLNFVNNFSVVSSELIGELQDALKGIALNDKARAEINELTGTLRSNLDKVVQHGKRADAIVKNMLLHSREGSGEHRPVDINSLVEESLNLAYHGARAEKQGFNITLERSLDPTAGEADVFPQDITRVLLNLISNGFYAATKRKEQAISDGYEPKLGVATRNLGDSVEITIKDNGLGISADVKEKIFNPFFTTKPAGEGTGLGLSISHDIIVKQHGGSIEVDTQPGEFTEIRVILPREAALLPERS